VRQNAGNREYKRLVDAYLDLLEEGQVVVVPTEDHADGGGDIQGKIDLQDASLRENAGLRKRGTGKECKARLAKCRYGRQGNERQA
jgi:hypothetical protein